MEIDVVAVIKIGDKKEAHTVAAEQTPANTTPQIEIEILKKLAQARLISLLGQSGKWCQNYMKFA